MKSFLSLAALGLAALALVGCDPEKMAGDEPEAAKPVAEKPKEEAKPLPPLADMPKDGDEVAVLETDKGRIVLMFYPERAPNHVANFKELVRSGFYDGTRFHRCIQGFMIQGGDPNSKDLEKEAIWGTGGNMVDGKEKNINAEFNDINHRKGILSAAREGGNVNSASSQFFIMHGDNANLNGQYSAFGKCIQGMEVVDQIVQSPTKDDNGMVFAKYAVKLNKATIETWPLK